MTSRPAEAGFHDCSVQAGLRRRLYAAPARVTAVLLSLLTLLGAVACRGNNPEEGVGYVAATGGDAQRGRQVIEYRQCSSCHTIPGVRGTQGLVGPPLMWFSRRTYIAGELPNTPENLVR